tara:strand:- start:5386 stop:6411 length:1026 start_codon:yes stop_codon:yes gene_type:complete
MNVKKRRIVYIGFAFDHHKNSLGGYHHIQKYLNYDLIINLQNEFDFPWFKKPKILSRVLKKFKSIISGKGTFFGILKVLYLNFKYEDLCFHFIYPENSYQWLHLFLNKNKLVFTIHQPVEFYKTNRWKKILKKVDLIICLKENQLEEINDSTGKSNCIYIPHGINTNLLKRKKNKKNKKILMVGNWLRDFSLANEVFCKIEIIDPTIEIVVVTNSENHRFFHGSKIKKLSNISNQELINLYNESSVLFCPLIDFTANNAILEAAVLGCHIFIATNSEISSGNIPNNYATFCSLSTEKIVPLLIDKVLDYDYDSSEKLSSLIKKEFSWKAISNKVYQSINKI